MGERFEGFVEGLIKIMNQPFVRLRDSCCQGNDDGSGCACKKRRAKKDIPGWIPSCLKLEQRQIDKVVEWRHSFPKQTLQKMEENYGGDTITSDVDFTCRETGIACNITAHCGRRSCCLSIDDDNSLIYTDTELGTKLGMPPIPEGLKILLYHRALRLGEIIEKDCMYWLHPKKPHDPEWQFLGPEKSGTQIYNSRYCFFICPIRRSY